MKLVAIKRGSAGFQLSNAQQIVHTQNSAGNLQGVWVSPLSYVRTTEWQFSMRGNGEVQYIYIQGHQVPLIWVTIRVLVSYMDKK